MQADISRLEKKQLVIFRTGAERALDELDWYVDYLQSQRRTPDRATNAGEGGPEASLERVKRCMADERFPCLPWP